MRKFSKLFMMVTAALLVGIIMSGCGGGANAVPKVKENTNITFNLDLYNKRTATIKVEDYIDENGAEGVTYDTEKSDGISVSAISNGRFTVTAQTVGTSTVKLRALLNDQVKASVTLTFNITDSTPQQAAVEGIENGEGYTMSGNATTIQGQNYVFKVYPNYDYVVSGQLKAKYSIGDGEEKELTGELDEAAWSETYVFTIPGAEITGDITITEINGLTQNTGQSYPVSGIGINGDYQIIGGESAFANKDYSFKVVVPAYYSAPVATYKIGSGESKNLTAITLPESEDGKEFGYKVPKADITDEIEIEVSVNLVTKNFSSTFYNPDTWTDVVGQEGRDKPTLESDGSLKFQHTVIKIESVLPVVSSGAIGEWNSISFMIKSDNEFDFVMFATSNTQLNEGGTAWRNGDNWIRLSSKDGKVYLNTCQSNGAPLAKVPDSAGYVQGDWNRIDLAFRRTAENSATIKLFLNGVKVDLESEFEGVGFDENVQVIDGDFIFVVARPNYGGRAAALAFETPFYIAPVED